MACLSHRWGSRKDQTPPKGFLLTRPRPLQPYFYSLTEQSPHLPGLAHLTKHPVCLSHTPPFISHNSPGRAPRGVQRLRIPCLYLIHGKKRLLGLGCPGSSQLRKALWSPEARLPQAKARPLTHPLACALSLSTRQPFLLKLAAPYINTFSFNPQLLA